VTGAGADAAPQESISKVFITPLTRDDEAQ
jgi:hypothetical protein